MNKLLFIALLGLATPMSAQSDDIAGGWIKSGKFVQMNIGCTQRWMCVPEQAAIYSADLKLSGPAPQVTAGSCSAGGGDITACNVCLASQPSEPCTLRLEQR